MSIVLVATAVGAIIGPNLVRVSGTLASRFGIPALAGPFLLAGAAYASAGIVLWLLLRPDPLLLRAALLPLGHQGRQARDGAIDIDRCLRVSAGMVLGGRRWRRHHDPHPADHGRDHDHHANPHRASWARHRCYRCRHRRPCRRHVPAIAVLWLAGRPLWPPSDRCGCWLRPVGFCSAAWAPVDSVGTLLLALVLLGLGWNLGLVSGTTLVTDAVPLATRARTQGVVDFGVALAGAGGGLSSGLIVTATSYATLTLAGGILGLLIIPIAAMARTRSQGLYKERWLS